MNHPHSIRLPVNPTTYAIALDIKIKQTPSVEASLITKEIMFQRRRTDYIEMTSHNNIIID